MFSDPNNTIPTQIIIALLGNAYLMLIVSTTIYLMTRQTIILPVYVGLMITEIVAQIATRLARHWRYTP